MYYGEQIIKNGKIIPSDSLAGKLMDYWKKIITKPHLNVLHQVRSLSNYAVHEIEFPAKRTVLKGIEVIENILLNIYEIKDLNFLKMTKTK